jgi:hypothetical protein
MSTAAKTLDTQDLEQRVKGMYEEVAHHPDGDFHFEAGRALAERPGYAAKDLDRIPAATIDSFAGVGHFLDLATIGPGRDGARSRKRLGYGQLPRRSRGWAGWAHYRRGHDRRAAGEGDATRARGRDDNAEFREGYSKIHHDETRHIGYGSSLRGAMLAWNSITETRARTGASTRPGTTAIRLWSTECDRAESLSTSSVEASTQWAVGARDAEGRRRGIARARHLVAATFPRFHNASTAPFATCLSGAAMAGIPLRKRLPRMPPAGLEPATRCLEGASTCCGLLPPVAQSARRSDGPHIAAAVSCGLPLPPRFHVDPPAFTQSDSEVSGLAAHLLFVRSSSRGRQRPRCCFHAKAAALVRHARAPVLVPSMRFVRPIGRRSLVARGTRPASGDRV